jgi:parvulin-like peptidyl-prolyl isomerase
MAKRAIIFLVVFIALAFGLLAWHSQYEKAKAAKRVNAALTRLTNEEVVMILEGEGQPQALAALAQDTEQREKVLESLQQLLALAREARVTGLAEDPKVREQLEIAELEVLAFAYDKKLKKDAGKPNDPGPPLGWAMQKISDEEVTAFWKKAENEVKFEKFIKSLQERTPGAPKLTPEQTTQIREQWAKAVIASEIAKKEGLDQEPQTRLQLEFQKARILATEYGKRHQKELQPTKEEIAAYMKEHDLDPAKKRKVAEQVLQRAKAGEDFAKLAAEFSEDPGSKDKGGLYEDVKKGQFVPQFEAAALSLQPGQIADQLVETQYGYHIIKLENRGATKDKEGKDEETFSARHILIMTQVQDAANPFAQPVSMEQKAQQEVQQAKIKKFLDEIMARNPIEVPTAEELKIPVPEMPEGAENPMMPGMMPPGGGAEAHSEDDGHNHGTAPPAPKAPKKK